MLSCGLLKDRLTLLPQDCHVKLLFEEGDRKTVDEMASAEALLCKNGYKTSGRRMATRLTFRGEAYLSSAKVLLVGPRIQCRSGIG